MTATPATSAVYRWPHDEVARKTALSSTHETISVLFTFKFPKPLGSGAPEWDASFGEFSNAVMKSSGGVVATSCSSGWELNKSSFCGAFRYLSQDAMKLFLEGGEGKRLFETLQSLATAGVEVEYLETRQFDQGWQGSVDKTRPDNPVATAMFSDLQSKLGGDGFAALRRV